MKFAVLVLGLVVGVNCLAQTPVGALESPELNVLYRGYANRIIPSVSNNDGKPVGLIGKNATVEAIENRDYFIVKPGNGPSCELSVVLWDGDEFEIIKTVEYRIALLPDPEVYWGNVPNGGIANITSTEIGVKYVAEFPLKSEFNILAWKVSYQDESVSGNGSSLLAAKDFLKKIPSGALLQFEFKILSYDGITRLKTGQWQVNSWDDELDPNPAGIQRK